MQSARDDAIKSASTQAAELDDEQRVHRNAALAAAEQSYSQLSVISALRVELEESRWHLTGVLAELAFERSKAESQAAEAHIADDAAADEPDRPDAAQCAGAATKRAELCERSAVDALQEELRQAQRQLEVARQLREQQVEAAAPAALAAENAVLLEKVAQLEALSEALDGQREAHAPVQTSTDHEADVACAEERLAAEPASTPRLRGPAADPVQVR